MKTGPSSVYVLAVLLLILGASLSVYRHVQYEGALAARRAAHHLVH